ncbi:hypothetical protein HanRHA438_Chr16g0775201 [Helianthus annuus]|nr:hypothetical protein HanRHA438_Chr16g0775201 [Helianthus annuus]
MLQDLKMNKEKVDEIEGKIIEALSDPARPCLGSRSPSPACIPHGVIHVSVIHFKQNRLHMFEFVKS